MPPAYELEQVRSLLRNTHSYVIAKTMLESLITREDSTETIKGQARALLQSVQNRLQSIIDTRTTLPRYEG